MKILLIGATAGTGLEAAIQLLDAGIDIRVLARNAEKAQKLYEDTPAEIVISDLTAPNEAFYQAFHGVDAILFTAAVPPGFAKEDLIRSTDYGGVAAAVGAAQKAGFKGRFVYMNTIGCQHKSFFIWLLNKVKTNLVHWRLQAEKVVRESGLPYTIVRAGILNNDSLSDKPIQVTFGDIPIRLKTVISRADTAAVMIECLKHDVMAGKEISVIYGGSEDYKTRLAAGK